MIRELRNYHVQCDGLTCDLNGSRCSSQSMIMAYDEIDLRDKLYQRHWRSLPMGCREPFKSTWLCPGMHAEGS